MFEVLLVGKLKRRRSALLSFIAGYIVAELTCYVRHLKYFARLASYRTPMSLNFDRERWSRFFSERIRRECARNPRSLLSWVSSCFWGAPVTQLCAENVEAMLLMLHTSQEAHDWPYSTHAKASAKELLGHVNNAMNIVHDGQQLKSGADDSYHIRVNNPCTNHGAMTPLYKPMLVQSIFWAIRMLGNAYFTRCGFECNVCNETGFVYWRRNGSNKANKALVFIHGLGLGSVPYILFIRRLASALQNTHVTVIVVEIAMIAGFPARKYGGVGPSAKKGHLRPPFPRPDEIALSISKFLQESGHYTADFVAHSFGTVIATYVSNHQPNVVGKIAFVDPLCFFPHNTVFWPFCYKPIYGWSMLRELSQGHFCKALEDYYDSLVFGDINQNHVIRNCTWLMEFCNHENLLGKSTLLLLSGKDVHSDVEELVAYMTTYHPSVNCHVVPEWTHGSVWKHPDIAVSILCPFLIATT